MPEPHPPFLLTAFGIPHAMGMLTTRDGVPNPNVVSSRQFLQHARGMRLAGVEAPVDAEDLVGVERLEADLRELGLQILPDYVGLLDGDTERFIRFAKVAAKLGSRVVRVLVSRVLCGDRRGVEGGWEAFLDRLLSHLRVTLPIAEEFGIVVALENHQDCTSDDLLRLYELSGCSSSFGVALDTGNPLAVGEGPLEYARRLSSIIRHVHLKDYTIHYAPEGYRLVRCAAGDGVVPFAEILALLRPMNPNLVPGIEIAAQATRTIPILEDSWWDCYPSTHSRFLPEALRVLWRHGKPADQPYSSAWERGEASDEILAEEWDVLHRSVAYFQNLSACTSAGAT